MAPEPATIEQPTLQTPRRFRRAALARQPAAVAAGRGGGRADRGPRRFPHARSLGQWLRAPGHSGRDGSGAGPWQPAVLHRGHQRRMQLAVLASLLLHLWLSLGMHGIPVAASGQPASAGVGPRPLCWCACPTIISISSSVRRKAVFRAAGATPSRSSASTRPRPKRQPPAHRSGAPRASRGPSRAARSRGRSRSSGPTLRPRTAASVCRRRKNRPATSWQTSSRPQRHKSDSPLADNQPAARRYARIPRRSTAGRPLNWSRAWPWPARRVPAGRSELQAAPAPAAVARHDTSAAGSPHCAARRRSARAIDYAAAALPEQAVPVAPSAGSEASD